MMLKREIEEELKKLNEYFAEIHKKYINREIEHQIYILLLAETNAMIGIYNKILKSKRIKKIQSTKII